MSVVLYCGLHVHSIMSILDYVHAFIRSVCCFQDCKMFVFEPKHFFFVVERACFLALVSHFLGIMVKLRFQTETSKIMCAFYIHSDCS